MQTSLRQAIARIDIVQGERSVGHGTGCLVAPDLVMTAMHVVANRQASPPALLPGTIVLTFPTHRSEATVVEGRWDPRSDWALLRCATPPPGVRPVPLADSVGDGAAWETFGFPEANSRDGLAQLGTVENVSGTFESVAAYQLYSRQAAAGVGAPVKGLSGGPVIVDGALVGVFRSSLLREGQFNVAGTLYACPVETMLERCADLLPIPDPCRGLPGLPRNPLPAAPYRFLERFTARDAEIFFGRNREIRELYDRVTASDGAPVVLLYGQSGAGKSSFLDAGLLPRLVSSHATVYVRRDRVKGLLQTLIDGMAHAFAANLPSGLSSAQALHTAWIGIETSTARPLVVILDQVEEVFTLPSTEATEAADFMAAVQALLTSGPRPQGRLVLGFRKEWLGEIQKPLDQQGIDYSKVFLEALDAEAVTEVATGLAHTKRLRERYGLTVEPGLAAAIASDLAADQDSPVAPTLQVLLSRMWIEATATSSESPGFTAELYARVTRAGFLLTDFLDHQLTALAESAHAAGGSVADVVESGLALDVLRFHVSRLGTAEERSRQQLMDQYHRDDDVAWLVGTLKRLYLLTEPAGDGAHSGATRLAHDTLAQAVRTRCDESLLPGQRARRVLEARAGEWADGRVGTPLDARDLLRVEQGVPGMRTFRPDEERLIAASRVLRQRDAVRQRTLKYSAVAATLLILAAAGAAWSYRQQNLKDQTWSDLINFASSIPTVLNMQPALGLAVAIDVADGSLELNRGVVPAGIQEGLALALDSARERFVWTLPSAGVSSAMSHDRRVAVGTLSGVIHVYRLDGPDAPQVITASRRVSAVSFSDDGEFLVAALGSEGIGVWRRNGDRVADLPDPLADYAQSVKFAPDGHTLVALTGPLIGPNHLHLFDLDSRVLDTTPMQVLGVMDRHRPLEVVRNYDNQLVVATEFRDHVFLSTTDGTKWLSTVELTALYPSLRFFEIGGLALARNAAGHALLAVASRANLIAVDLDSQARPREVDQPATVFTRVSFGADAKSLIVGAADGLVRVYNLTGQPMLTPFLVANDVAALAVSADGELAAVAGDASSPRLSVIDMVGVGLRAPERAVWDLIYPSNPGIVRSAMAFLPTGQLVAVGPDSAARVWELELKPGWSAVTSRAVVELAPDPMWTDVAVDADGGTIALVGGYHGVRLFGADGSVKGGWRPNGLVTAAVLSPDGQILVTGTETGTLTIAEVPSGKPVTQFRPEPVPGSDFTGSTIHAVAFDPAGQQFAVAFGEGHVRIYRRDGTPIADLPSGQTVAVTALMFYPKGGLIAGSSRGEVRLINIEGKRNDWAIRAFAGGSVNGLALHASGSPLFVAGSQGLRALDIDSGSLLNLPMFQSATPMKAVAVSPDGRLLVGAKEAGGFAFWRAGWQEWLLAGCDRLQRHPLFTVNRSVPLAVSTLSDLVMIEPQRAYDACNRRAPSK